MAWRTDPDQPRLIETDEFPFEFLSDVAKRESWRKEIYRPVYHLHKWWAKRLGSVFRGIILGCNLSRGETFDEAFYKRHDLSSYTVLDPFMGSGTTIGEAHKLGCVALGQDINPVACESVRIALGPINRRSLVEAFSILASTVGERIKSLYRSKDNHGYVCDVLYYFWVKNIPCPQCQSRLDLFPSRVIARNAYPDRKPEVQICCPGCGDIFSEITGSNSVHCRACGLDFNPNEGTVKGAKATCGHCGQEFSVIDAVRSTNQPPGHRLYGKLILNQGGNKKYLSVTNEDIKQYDECSFHLDTELQKGRIRLPTAGLSDGYNTRQVIKYNYRLWRDFFNKRQLLALGWLQQSIFELPEIKTRDAFLTLFSGLLEFNNMFASYKGEGTGAVRHMFSHHILKPERTPIEANVWGTHKSSGSFIGLYKSRLLRLVEYRKSPFEVRATGNGKCYQSCDPFSGEVETTFPSSNELKTKGIYLSCGSSDHLSVRDKTVDAVITDPPFFDNVHYSELADFFYAWQSLYPRGYLNGAPTTRHPREVQDVSADRFSEKLRDVLQECHRVLKDQGILAFTYHHSRTEGWVALSRALLGAGFVVVNSHPVKAEMSVATPKSQAKEPIQLDVVLVCRKRGETVYQDNCGLDIVIKKSLGRAEAKAKRLLQRGFRLSRNDLRVIVISQFLAEVTSIASPGRVIEILQSEQQLLENAVDRIGQRSDTVSVPVSIGGRQIDLPFQ
jgi:putative DNA methylase